MNSSSSPPSNFRSTLFKNARNPIGLRLQPTLPSSSPTLANAASSGEISPSFDASFTSSMSITNSHQIENSKNVENSSPFRMDISPAITKPLRVITATTRFHETRPPLFDRTFTPALPPSNYPFLQNLFNSNEISAIERSHSPESYLPTSHNEPGHRLERFATLPLPKALRHRPFEFTSTLEHHSTGEIEGSMAPPPVPTSTITLHAPVLPLKRFSDSDIPTFTRLVDSSPDSNRMELDSNFNSPSSAHRRLPSHPRSLSDSNLPSPSRNQEIPEEELQLSGASDRLADLFTDDLSPIRINSRKRFLNLENSPTPNSPSASTSTLHPAPPLSFTRRSFEKASSISSMSAVSRRRTSGTLIAPAKSLVKRPSMSSVKSAAMEQALAKVLDEENQLKISGNYKRQAQVSESSGKPIPKMMRRAYSVVEAINLNPLSLRDGNILNNTNLNYRASTKADGYFSTQLDSLSTGGIENQSNRIGEEKVIGKRPVERGSPLTGFRTQEEKGKALPCFGVKEDGLMRITADTLNDLLSGHYVNTISNFSVIDCRFSYEFSGGHIISAINLPTVVEVESQLLTNCEGGAPVPSTSEGFGIGKRVLIFHCEFSAKRAPTSAKHLRSKDRLLNIAAYPNVHYPEVYILQGGYLEFWKRFPALCEGPVGYVSMDDPSHLEKRSIDLNAFRQQQGKRGFNRAKSFTFGESVGGGMMNITGTRPPLGRQASSSHLLSAAFIFPKNPILSNSSTHLIIGTTTEQENNLETNESETITEEIEFEGDSSFQSSSGSSPCSARIAIIKPKSSSTLLGGLNRSPCPLPPKINMMGGMSGVGNRRGLARAQTSSSILFGR